MFGFAILSSLERRPIFFKFDLAIHIFCKGVTYTAIQFSYIMRTIFKQYFVQLNIPWKNFNKLRQLQNINNFDKYFWFSTDVTLISKQKKSKVLLVAVVTFTTFFWSRRTYFFIFTISNNLLRISFKVYRRIVQVIFQKNMHEIQKHMFSRWCFSFIPRRIK